MKSLYLSIIYREMYFKDLAHMIMEVDKSETSWVGQQIGN